MWNFLDLKCPSSDICEYQPQDNYVIENLRDFPTVLTTAADVLTSDHPLWKEMAVLRNIQVKYKRILRCDKCLIYLQRVGHCLKKMVLLNLSKTYLDLAERFLIGYQETSNVLHLPSRQQVEYVLIRTQASAKLVAEAIRYSRETFCFLIQKLKVGHSLLELVMATSITARLNVMLKAILIQLYDMYQKIFLWCCKVKQGKHNWPEKLNLPADLKKWITASESELMKPFPLSKTDAEFLMSVIKKKNGMATDDTHAVIEIDVDDDSDCYVVDETYNADYGEVIPRKKISKKSAPSLSKKQKLFLGKITCAQTLETLKDIWHGIYYISQDHLPQTLTASNRKIITNFFAHLTECHHKDATKNVKGTPSVSVIGMNFAKYLGFTPDQINECKSNPAPAKVSQTARAKVSQTARAKVSQTAQAKVSQTAPAKVSQTVPAKVSQTADRKLQPVKTWKELKMLYKQLCGILEFSNEVKKHKKLKKMYKRRLADIKLLKQNGEKVFVRKLIYCTSKVLLTICQE